MRLGLHAGQLEVAQDPARFKVVCCGRQWGKTLLGAALCVKEAAENGGQVWWVGPSFPVGELGMLVVNRLCRQIPGTRFEGRPVWRTTLPTGGTIQMRSADNPDSLRGATLDGVVFDEAATAKEGGWTTLRPTLAIRKGWALFISTPNGQNWFYDLFNEAENLSDWKRWRFPSTASPYFDPAEAEKSKLEMSSIRYSQEHEAEFVSAASGLFHADWIQHYRETWAGEERFYVLGDESVALADCSVFHTVDLAWSISERADYTVISTWAVTPKKHLILADLVRGHFQGPDIVPRLRGAYDRWGGYLIVEKATRQMSIIQEAERTGLPIRVVRAEKDKIARSMPAQARMERRTVWFPPASVPWFHEVENELLAFPGGAHDDFIDTFSYACAQVGHGSAYADHGLMTV